jgi:prepilin-type N-terminal cleavage/methylation domain-containing protein/prepilin-type processing-associated H-X9-DG protein
MKHPSRLLPQCRRAFTLIELLCVIAIIALLATLLAPMTATLIEKGRQVKCAQNLKNLFVFLNAAANDNGNRYPRIQIDPEKREDSEGGEPQKPLFETLERYGCSRKDLQCPSDLAGANWFTKKGTSYMWQPFSEDEPTQNITILSRRGATLARLSRVRLVQDWDLPHAPQEIGMRKRMNVLYADGHVSLR